VARYRGGIFEPAAGFQVRGDAGCLEGAITDPNLRILMPAALARRRIMEWGLAFGRVWW
jgi:hypothetical protein